MLPSGSSASPQQDSRDIGASVIDHLTAGVSAQCELMTTPGTKSAITSICMNICTDIFVYGVCVCYL